MVFLAILYALRPDVVDLSKARTRSNKQNLEEAFRVAERELRIPKLLDPDGESTSRSTLRSGLPHRPLGSPILGTTQQILKCTTKQVTFNTAESDGLLVTETGETAAQQQKQEV